VIAKSWARIHKDNLVNFGIIPLTFENPADYEKIAQGDVLEITGLRDALKKGSITIRNSTKGFEFRARADVSARAIEVLEDGGEINHVRKK
jgi:aconitate hydratase